MKKPTIYLLAYSLLLLVGGVIGFLTKGSVGSIMAGTLSSFLMAFAAIKINQGSTTAVWGAVLLTAFLAVFFSYRLYITGSFMPGGLMVICSGATLAYLWMSFCPRCCTKKKCDKA